MTSNGQEIRGTLTVERREEILLVGLSRPEKRNAMNDGMVLELEQVFSNIPDGVKCAVIFGEGKHFSAGLDLSELTDRDVVQGFHHSRMWHRAMDSVQFGSVPVVAVLHGACVGGGLELASACHLRVAAGIGDSLCIARRAMVSFVGGGSPPGFEN